MSVFLFVMKAVVLLILFERLFYDGLFVRLCSIHLNVYINATVGKICMHVNGNINVGINDYINVTADNRVFSKVFTVITVITVIS